jgi:hypothetical protein
MLNFWKRSANPLITPKEKAVQDITNQLVNWSKYSDREEILSAVLSRVFPEKVHIHKNPRRAA